jgi:hypothetical protein
VGGRPPASRVRRLQHDVVRASNVVLGLEHLTELLSTLTILSLISGVFRSREPSRAYRVPERQRHCFSRLPQLSMLQHCRCSSARFLTHHADRFRRGCAPQNLCRRYQPISRQGRRPVGRRLDENRLTIEASRCRGCRGGLDRAGQAEVTERDADIAERAGRAGQIRRFC